MDSEKINSASDPVVPDVVPAPVNRAPRREELRQRVLPHSIEAEISVLGAIMIGEAASVETASEIVKDFDFYREAHGTIFSAMLALNAAGSPVDIITLKDELIRRGCLDAIGGIAYLMQLGEYIPTTANLAYHAEIVADKSRLRKFIQVATETARSAYAQDKTSLEVFADTLRSVESVFGSGGEDQERAWRGGDSLATTFARNLQQRYNSGGGIIGISSGMSNLDAITCGFQAGKLWVLAGPPGCGKTGMVISLAAQMALAGKHPAIFEMEMDEAEVAERFVCYLAQVPNTAYQRASLTNEQVARTKKALDQFRSMSIHCSDCRGITLSGIRAKCRELHRQGKLDIIFMDYLQIIRPEGDQLRMEHRLQIDDICKGLKSLAREFKVPVVLLSQLSRGLNSREDKRPVLSDLKDSGGIEAEADGVAFIYRPAYYAPKEKVQYVGDEAVCEDVECIIAKHRGGATGTVELVATLPYSMFSDPPKRFDDYTPALPDGPGDYVRGERIN